MVIVQLVYVCVSDKEIYSFNHSSLYSEGKKISLAFVKKDVRPISIVYLLECLDFIMWCYQ